jgi:clan AA aspartic protease (TIGR02281 family)
MRSRLSLGKCAVAFGAVLVVVSLAPVAAQAQATAKAPSKGKIEDQVPAAARSAFEGAGLKVSSLGLAFPEELELSKAVKDTLSNKKKLVLADRELFGQESKLEEIKAQIEALKQRHTLLNAQLANVTDTFTNNRLVGEINTAVGLIDAGTTQQQKQLDVVKTARGKATDIREEFVVEILGMRELADKVVRRWETAAADPALKKALDETNSATGKTWALKPSQQFVASEKQLKALEESMISESIKLRNDGGSLWVDVSINGKKSEEFVVDSGASSISIPVRMATALGIEPKDSDPDVTVSLADGSTVDGKLIKIENVRVGKFVVESVECVVLGPEAIAAPPLLGLSFLGQFKFEVDTSKSELKLVKVDSGEQRPATKAKGKVKTKKKS